MGTGQRFSTGGQFHQQGPEGFWVFTTGEGHRQSVGGDQRCGHTTYHMRDSPSHGNPVEGENLGDELQRLLNTKKNPALF